MAQHMTQKQALAEAKKRWGKTACIQHNPKALTSGESALTPPKDPRRLHHRYSVGYVWMNLFFNVLGSGDSWEEAFKDAGDKKAYH